MKERKKIKKIGTKEDLNHGTFGYYHYTTKADYVTLSKTL